MLTKVTSASHFGIDITPIDVEVNIYKKGFPGFSIIGLPFLNYAEKIGRYNPITLVDYDSE